MKTAIRKVSKKQSKRLREYKEDRDIYMNEHPMCEVCGISYSTEIHHKKGRVGAWLTNPDYFLAVCRNCHNEIEKRPLWAKENGFSLSRL